MGRIGKKIAESKKVTEACDAMNKYLGAMVTYDFKPNTEAAKIHCLFSNATRSDLLTFFFVFYQFFIRNRYITQSLWFHLFIISFLSIHSAFLCIQITLSYNYAFIGFFVAWIKIPRNTAARIIPTG